MPAQLSAYGFAALWHPELITAAATIVALYLYAALRMRRQGVPGSPTGWHLFYFLSGVALLYLAVGSPLDVISDNYLFSAHMAEHMLLGVLAPPLLLLGLTDAFWRPVLRVPGLRRIIAAVTRPLIALLLFNVVFAVYHFPYFFELGLRNDGLHLLEHAILFVTGLIMWWPVVSPSDELPRLTPPGKLLYMFGDAIVMTPVFALILFAPTPLYPTYVHAVRLFGMTPLQDQQMGAVVMKVGGEIGYGVAAGALFIAWARREAARERASSLTVLAPGKEPVRILRAASGDAPPRGEPRY